MVPADVHDERFLEGDDRLRAGSLGRFVGIGVERLVRGHLGFESWEVAIQNVGKLDHRLWQLLGIEGVFIDLLQSGVCGGRWRVLLLLRSLEGRFGLFGYRRRGLHIGRAHRHAVELFDRARDVRGPGHHGFDGHPRCFGDLLERLVVRRVVHGHVESRAYATLRSNVDGNDPTLSSDLVRHEIEKLVRHVNVPE